MKAFVITSGTIFALLVVAHVLRLRVEPHLAKDPWFLLSSILAAGLSVWAGWLVWKARRDGRS